MVLEWFKKGLIKRWIKELDKNIEGMRKMAEAYRQEGGFKEVSETIAQYGVETSLAISKQLLEEGRKAELEFADACEKLAVCYESLLMKIKEAVAKL